MEPAVCPLHPDATLREAFGATDQFWGYGGDFRYAACPECACWILNPRPDKSEIGHYYGKYYDDAQLSLMRHKYDTKPARRAGAVSRLRAFGFLRRLERIGGSLGPGQRTLDVGCGLGAFPRFVRDMTGVDARGVDFSAECRDFAKDVHGIDVDVGELADQQYPDGHFDAVTAWHVLEHVYDPPTELAEMARIIKPGGWLMIEVPTVGAVGALFRSRWLYLQAPTHLYHFRPDPLRAMIEEAGFEIAAVRRPWFPGEIAGSLMLTFGLTRFLEKVFGAPDRPLRHKLLTVLLYAQMIYDLPIGIALALLRKGGLLRVFARRR